MAVIGTYFGTVPKDTLRRVDELLKAGYTHVVDADLKGDFDSIPHDRLMARLKTKIADGSVLSLIEKFLRANILDGTDQWTPTAGAPQGAVLSPLLSNVSLDPLDHLLAQSGFEMVRYADDFVILCRTADEAAKALGLVTQWTTENGLTLHPTKTRVVDSRIEGFDFLGYHFHGTRHSVRDKSLKKLKDTLREKTRRTNGDSLHFIITSVNQTLRGWFSVSTQSNNTNSQTCPPRCVRASGPVHPPTPPCDPQEENPPPRQRPGSRLSEMAERLLRQSRAVQSDRRPPVGLSILTEVNHQPESRMREICQSGSEGGGTQTNESSLPPSLNHGESGRQWASSNARSVATRSGSDSARFRSSSGSSLRWYNSTTPSGTLSRCGTISFHSPSTTQR